MPATSADPKTSVQVVAILVCVLEVVARKGMFFIISVWEESAFSSSSSLAREGCLIRYLL